MNSRTLGQQFHTYSISSTLETVLRQASSPIRVLSNHQHALNLVTPTNLVFAFVSPHHGNGPFHIVITPTLLAQLQRQPTFDCRNHLLQAGPITLDLSTFTRWDPHLPALSSAPTNAFAILYQRYQQRGHPALGFVKLAHDDQSPTNTIPRLLPSLTDRTAQFAYQRAQWATELLYQGLCESNTLLIANGTTLLAGLGPGLTPAGDDFLVGLLAAFYAFGPHYAQSQRTTWQTYPSMIANAASGRTTQLSAAWLTYAAAGAFGAAWHNLIQAMNANQPQAVILCADRLLATGATSGADAMGGFLWGVAVLERLVTE